MKESLFKWNSTRLFVTALGLGYLVWVTQAAIDKDWPDVAIAGLKAVGVVTGAYVALNSFRPSGVGNVMGGGQAINIINRLKKKNPDFEDESDDQDMDV